MNKTDNKKFSERTDSLNELLHLGTTQLTPVEALPELGNLTTSPESNVDT